MLKRAFDLVGAFVGLMIATPLIVLLILLIRRDSPGPGMFAQHRVGRRGRIFICRKLRTMRLGTAHVPTHEAQTSAVTRVGSKLRRTKLDELPQLWNVLVGEMSFVGPRPCLPTQTLLIKERRKRGVLALRPGITGLAQMQGIDMSEPILLAEIDADYLRNRTFAGDIAILWRTIFGSRGNGDRVRH